MPSKDPSRDPLFRTIAITAVVTFVLVASTLLLDNLLDRTSIDEAKALAASASTSAPAQVATSTPTQVAAQPVRAVTVEEGEMYLNTTATRLNNGVIAFVVTNHGKIHHEFVIVTGDPTGTNGDEPGRVSEANHIGGDNGPEIGDIAPGQTKVLTVTLAAGTYTAMCNLPGHYAAGMHFQFTVA
jgi:uncharacterized cupredoxin-like copper-binding protein